MRVLALIGVGAVLGAILVLVVAPRLDWSAAATPGATEKGIAGTILRRWVQRKAIDQNNPLPASAENLKVGREEFGEHCAVCHGADGSARNQLGADFYPPIVRLERGGAGWTDGELYFIVVNGIRYTGMPGFGAHHKPETLWQIILWIRHLPHLTAQERAQIQGGKRANAMEHEEPPEHHDPRAE